MRNPLANDGDLRRASRVSLALTFTTVQPGSKYTSGKILTIYGCPNELIKAEWGLKKEQRRGSRPVTGGWRRAVRTRVEVRDERGEVEHRLERINGALRQ